MKSKEEIQAWVENSYIDDAAWSEHGGNMYVAFPTLETNYYFGSWEEYLDFQAACFKIDAEGRLLHRHFERGFNPNSEWGKQTAESCLMETWGEIFEESYWEDSGFEENAEGHAKSFSEFLRT